QSQNETVFVSGTFLCRPPPHLGSAFSCKDLVACPVALAAASGSLPGRRCGGRNSSEGHDRYDASIAHRLHYWTCCRAAVGIIDRALEGVARHHWNASPRSPDIAECLLGPACVVVVRTNGSRYAFRSSNGYALVGSDRNRNWRAQCAANLPSRCFDHGLKASAHVVQGYPARDASVYRQRDETRLGVCMAFTYGCGDFRDDPDRF